MIIKFKCDYIGRETAMKQFRKGDVTAELSHQACIEIIRLGGAEEVIDEDPVFKPLPDFSPMKKRISKPKVKHESDAQ